MQKTNNSDCDLQQISTLTAEFQIFQKKLKQSQFSDLNAAL